MQLALALILLLAAQLPPRDTLSVAPRATSAPTEQSPEALSSEDADDLIQDVFGNKEQGRYEEVAQVYLDLLASIDGRSDDAVLQRYLDELMPVLPADVRAEVGVGAEAESVAVARLAEETGAYLARFWQNADPLPATVLNERLVEHLERSVEARRKYSDENGHIDDRGRIYIRYGEPTRIIEIRGNQYTAFSAARRYASPAGSAALARDAEVAPTQLWVYTHVHRWAHFLFMYDDQLGHFRRGSASELLPRAWAGSSRRAFDFLTEAENIYDQLALHHPDYGLIYSDIANYIADARSGVPASVDQSPRVFALKTFSKGQTLDQHIEQTQLEVLPTAYTNVRESVERITISARTARFLNQDGSTRAEIYWGTSVDALKPDRRSRSELRRYGIDSPPDHLSYMVIATVEVQNAEQMPVERLVRRYRMGPYGSDAGALVPSPVRVPAAGPETSVRVQWDVLALEDDVEAGPLVKYQTLDLPPLTPLRGADGHVEASDLKPLVLMEEGIPTDLADETAAYPFAALSPDVPLALYFEVYHLAQADDGTRSYRVDYSVRRGGKRISRSDGAAWSSASFEAAAADVQDFIVVDLDQWDVRGEIEIVLRFTDETSGQSVERSIAFRFAPTS